MDKKALKLISDCHSLAITGAKERQKAADLWDAVRAFRKQADAKKEEVCRPLKTKWDAAKKPFDSFIKECQAVEQKLQTKMSEYDLEQERIAEALLAKQQAKIEAQNEKAIKRAELKGTAPILKEVPDSLPLATSLETQAGTTQARQKKKVYTPLDHVSLMKSFPEIFEINMPKFNALAKTGVFDNRKDVEVTEEFVYSQRGYNQ